MRINKHWVVTIDTIVYVVDWRGESVCSSYANVEMVVMQPQNPSDIDARTWHDVRDGRTMPPDCSVWTVARTAQPAILASNVPMGNERAVPCRVLSFDSFHLTSVPAGPNSTPILTLRVSCALPTTTHAAMTPSTHTTATV
ncbi:hypothetical protein LPJ58_000932 [Coemansia sp. RSA 1591]|nr:hypothetical protein LPJ58_000932 [Coemansia sp. RSA 1591]KAJ2838829.1 hypothetical protein J3B01_001150 [Coemansia erecta]